jgi:1-hydroxycarotenoid 3,4-desaturase
VYRCGLGVARIEVGPKRVTGVVLESGERLEADAVVFNGDVSALATGLLGDPVRRSVRGIVPQARSLSALTWCVRARTSGFQLSHHNVFFAHPYQAEFDALFGERRVTVAPTVYLSAQDRVGNESAPDQPERLMALINAPPDGDKNPWSEAAIEMHRQRAAAVMRKCGLELEEAGESVATSPAGFNRLFPSTGGALYGRANHGPFSAFDRGGSRTAVAGLYTVGGSVHPGPGVPMAALSGRLCAAAIVEDHPEVIFA